MKKRAYRISGILVIVLSVFCIIISGIRPLLFPTREVDFSPGFGYGPVVPAVILRQEIQMKKEFIRGVDLMLGNTGKISGLENLLMLIDESNTVLFTKKFDSKEIAGTDFYRFDFGKNIRIGNGKKCYLCLYSTNSDDNQNIQMIINTKSHFGKLSYILVRNADMINSLSGAPGPIDGSMVLKTFESNTDYFSGFQVILYLLSLLFGCVIFFFPEERAWILRFRLSPEWSYLTLGLVFGMILVFLTPPLQSPDENKHFYRSFQVSELNLFQTNPTIPAALLQTGKVYERLNFALVAKTDKADETAAKKIKLNTSDRVVYDLPKEIIPFFPQSLGISIGRLFTSSPLALMYWGRILNLIISLVIVFFAIRITPVHKWIFFLVALMPMTAFLFASLSHDVLTISLTFLLSALFFRVAFGGNTTVTKKDLYMMFILSFLLSLCKQPYYLAVFLYFLIPVTRVGSLKKYLGVFAGIGLLVIIGSQVSSVGSSFKRIPQQVQRSPVNAIPGNIQDSALSHALDQSREKSDVDAGRQKSFILANPARYLMIMVNTIKSRFRSHYLETMVGRLGWLSVFLPAWLINLYLFFLVFTALIDSDPLINPGWSRRGLVFGVALFTIMLIETALYLVWTPVGQAEINGVQGRYFIPVVPFFLFLLYNNVLSGRFDLLFSQGKTKRKSVKAAVKTKATEDIVTKERMFTQLWGYLVVCFAVLSLLCTLYVVLDKYYIVLI